MLTTEILCSKRFRMSSIMFRFLPVAQAKWEFLHDLQNFTMPLYPQSSISVTGNWIWNWSQVALEYHFGWNLFNFTLEDPLELCGSDAPWLEPELVWLESLPVLWSEWWSQEPLFFPLPSSPRPDLTNKKH